MMIKNDSEEEKSINYLKCPEIIRNVPNEVFWCQVLGIAPPCIPIHEAASPFGKYCFVLFTTKIQY